jgi:hypothetical protein
MILGPVTWIDSVTAQVAVTVSQNAEEFRTQYVTIQHRQGRWVVISIELGPIS